MSAFPRLANPPAASEPSNVADRFHCVGRILPESQELLSITPETPVRRALDMMESHDFSQLPVMAGSAVLGVFSHRSLSRSVSKLPAGKYDPCAVHVEEAMDIVDPSWFVQVGHQLKDAMDPLDRHAAVLVGDESRLQGIVTAIDVLRYLHRISIRFIYLEEIELAIRALLRSSMSAEEIEEGARLVLASGRKGPPPSRLEDMNFHDYAQIVGHGRLWEKCSGAFGGTRDRTRTNLESMANLRNDVLHFKRPLTDEDDLVLESTRDWLRMRARILDARSQAGRPA